MRVALNVPESFTEPRMWVQHQPVPFGQLGNLRKTFQSRTYQPAAR
jgi:hypothetical protein